MIFSSPAKLNLSFQVLRKREDGYHEIASVYQAISLKDTLFVERSDFDELICTGLASEELSSQNNLVLKAARLFRQKSQLAIFARFTLQKNIPLQAGLGGGSSNAATALWALNELADRPFTNDELALLAAEIGSDVPFFFSSGSAFCRGRGEIIQNISLPIEKENIWLAYANERLATPAVYRAVEVDSAIKRDPEATLERFLSGKREIFNDLEKAAFKLCPSLAEFKKKLYEAGFEEVAMTGSGSSFFCFGTPKKSTDISLKPIQFIQRIPDGWY